MTDATYSTDTSRVVALPRLASVFLITFAALLLISVAQLIDPMVRHDDFPALLADPTEFYEKTLNEGRWLNYVWHLRPWAGPSWLNFGIYQALWALFCAAFAVNAFGRTAPAWNVTALSLLIAVAPSAYLISLWFNTGIPGLAVVALFAVLATRLSDHTMRWLLFLFVPLALMAFTAHPILLAMICLFQHGAKRSFKDLAKLVVMFTSSFVLGLLLIYSLNYWEHGVFGIEVAEWRSPNPVHDVASALENLSLAPSVLTKFVMSFAFLSKEFAIVHIGIFLWGLFAMMRKDRWQALYFLTALALGVGLIVMQVTMTGVDTPPRAGTFLWVLYAYVFVSLLVPGPDGLNFPKRLARIFLMMIIVAYGMMEAKQYFSFRTWQNETQALSQTLPSGNGPIYVVGDIMTINGAEKAGIQTDRGLRMRLRYLTGERLIVCTESPVTCGQAFADGPPERVFTLPSDPDATFP